MDTSEIRIPAANDNEPTKTCTKCGETKPLTDFYVKAGKPQTPCKDCARSARKAYYEENIDSIKAKAAVAYAENAESVKAERREYRARNPDHISALRRAKRVERADEINAANRAAAATATPEQKEKKRLAYKAWREKNRESHLEYMRAYYRDHKDDMNAASRQYQADHKDEVAKLAKRWREENREHIAEKSRADYAVDPAKRIRQSVATSVRRALIGGKAGRKTFDLLGYTVDDLMRHLEAQFVTGMSWDNYTYRGWHIDHIRPLSSFSIASTDDADFKEAWALANLRPLWWLDNISKGAKWSPANDNIEGAKTSNGILRIERER